MLKKILLSSISILMVFTIGFWCATFLNTTTPVVADDLSLDEQEATIRAIKKVKPAVVSIVVNYETEMELLDLQTGKKTIYKEELEKGSGTGFLITDTGLILTNKHVVDTVDEDKTTYRVILNSGKKYYAQLIGKDPINDLAILKIFDKDLPYVELGDSKDLEIGSTVIAIGNALGVYQNSVTKGIISALNRNIIATDKDAKVENLSNVMQTDAEINFGNSGGPLINLAGEVVGVNVALDTSGSSIGFSIPIDDVKPVVKSVVENGLIVRPRLGVYYKMLDPIMAEENNLPRQEGAWLDATESGESAIFTGGPADIAGLEDGDIIFEINAIPINEENTLLSVTQRYKPGDKIGLKIQRGDKIIIRVVELGEF